MYVNVEVISESGEKLVEKRMSKEYVNWKRIVKVLIGQVVGCQVLLKFGVGWIEYIVNNRWLKFFNLVINFKLLKKAQIQLVSLYSRSKTLEMP